MRRLTRLLMPRVMLLLLLVNIVTPLAGPPANGEALPTPTSGPASAVDASSGTDALVTTPADAANASPNTPTLTSTPVLASADDKPCESINGPLYWINYRSSAGDAPFYALLRKTVDFGPRFGSMSRSSAIGLALTILQFPENSDVRSLLTAELNVAATPRLGIDTFTPVSLSVTINVLLTTAYQDNGSGNNAPFTNGPNETDPDLQLIQYLEGSPRDDPSCEIGPPPGSSGTPTLTPTATSTIRACTSTSSIPASFNGTPIASGDTVWFNSVVALQNVRSRSQPITLAFTNGSVTSPKFTVPVPNAIITFSPGVTTATTTYNASTNTWRTTVPLGLSGNTWLTGYGYPVPGGLPGGINPVSWQGTFTTDTPGVTVQWKWAAAAYTSFRADPATLGVKAADGLGGSDHAGTPENVKAYVTGGARGNGGSNYTGGSSSAASVSPCLVGSTPTSTASRTPTATSTVTSSTTTSATTSPSSTASDTNTPTSTETPTPTTSTTPTVSSTATSTITPTSTVTVSVTPSLTSTPTVTNSATPSNTPTATATVTATPSNSVTQTPSVTDSATSTITQTPTLTRTPTVNDTLTNTVTQTPSLTNSPSTTATRTLTATTSATSSTTATVTSTVTVTRTPTKERPPPYLLPGGLIVSVAYVDGPAGQPTSPQPWAGAPNVIFVGDCTSGVNCDTAAIRIDNPTSASAVLNDVSVAFPDPTHGLTVLDPWLVPARGVPSQLPLTIPAGSSVILASETTFGDFDTSELVPLLPGTSCAATLPPFYYPPSVTVTLNGSKTVLYDTGHILDSSGDGICDSSWRPIGTADFSAPPINVTLKPVTVNQQVQRPQTFVAHVTDTTGVDPLVGDTVNFNVISGPNVGHTGQGVSDSQGLVQFTYTSATTGADIILASVPRGSSTFNSNTVTAHWVTQLFGTLLISPLSVGLISTTKETFSVTALDASGTPVASLPVTLNVTGHNPSQLLANTDTNGVARFSYTNSGGPGTDVVQASATIGGGAVTSDSVTVPWDALVEVNISSSVAGSVLRYDGATGAPIDTMVSTGAFGLGLPEAAMVGPDGNLYVSNLNGGGDLVLRYAGASLAPLPAPGRFGATFVAARADVVSQVQHLTFGPDGNLYLMYSGGTVLRFDGATGAPLPAPSHSGAIFAVIGPAGSYFDLTFGRDRNLYVTQLFSSVYRFDGTTGAPLPAPGQTGATFVAAGTNGLVCAMGLASGPDGNLYVSNGCGGLGALRFDLTGAPLPAPGQSGATFVPRSSGGLSAGPGSVAFGPDGNLYVTDFNNDVYRYDGTSGVPRPAPGQSGALFVNAFMATHFSADSLTFSGPDLAPSFIPTSTPSPTTTLTPTQTNTVTTTPTVTITQTPTNTLTPTSTTTGTQSPSATSTISGTATTTGTPTDTGTVTATPTSTATATNSPTVTSTPTTTFIPGETITASITTPTSAQQVSGLVSVDGTVGVSGGTLAGYTVSYAALGSNAFTTAFTGTASVPNGLLGTFDTTALRDGQYALQLQVTAGDGQIKTLNGPIVNVVGQLKIGNMQFTVTDLAVPVSGIPIVVNRSYDNFLRAKGDFGVNWTEATSSGSTTQDTCLGNVTVQLPISNQPLTFTFNPLDTGVNLDGFEFFAPSWNVDTVTGAVLSDANGASTGLAAGVDTSNPQCWFDLYNNFSPYVPSTLIVTTTDGTAFKLNANVANGLFEVDAAGGFDKLTYSASGVTSTRGPAVHFTRDGQGRITTITDPEGKTLIYTFDGNGDLATVTDQNGGVTTYHYDTNHDLLSQTDPSGKTPATAHYNAQGQLTSIIDISGNTTTFDVTLSIHQQRITDARGNSRSELFDSFGNITQSTDPLGNTTSYTYDPITHKPLTRTDPLGHITTLAYNTIGDLTQKTDPLGNTTTFTYDAQRHVLGQSYNGHAQTSLTYDSSGALTSLKDAVGNTTSVTYDATSMPHQLHYANGLAQSLTFGATGVIGYVGPNTLNNSYTRDALGRVTSSARLAVGGTATTSYTYDAMGNLLTTTDPLGGVTTNTYDAAGRLLAVTDPDAHTTSYGYDSLGQVVKTTYPDGSTATLTYDPNGNVTKRTDSNGNVTTYVFDADNRVTETDYPDGSKETMGYDAAGRETSSTDGAGKTTTFDYDNVGRMIKVTDPLGNSTSYGYDPVSGDQTTVTDPAGHVVTYAYDANHRRISSSTTVTIAGVPTTVASAVTYTTLNQRASASDPLGRLTSYGYDVNGNLVNVLDPITQGGFGLTAQYEYDGNGNLTRQTDALGFRMDSAYDLNFRLTTSTYTDGATKTITYDPAGNVATTTNARGQVTTYAYDAMNRASTIAYPDHTVTFTYYSGGQRKTMADQRGATTLTTSYAIDTMGRVTTITEPDGRQLSYTYDAAGRRASSTTPAGPTTYKYDAAGRLTQVADPANRVTTYGYDSRGNLSQRVLPNGLTTAYIYDELNRLATLTTTGPSNALLWKDVYAVDAAGQRTSVQETDQTGAVTAYSYSYDLDGRLTNEQQVQGSTTLVNTTYTYDRTGSRLTRVDPTGTITSTYNGRGEFTTQTGPSGTTTYTYDADGNQLTSTAGGVTTVYSYDSQNRLLGVTVGATQTASYSYDADGNRTSSTTGGITTTYLVDPSGLDGLAQVVETTQSGGPTVDYVYGNERISLDQGSGNISFYLNDGNENTRLLVDSTGAVRNSYRYDAFGQLLASAGTVANPFLYGGQQFDAGVGLYYLRARYLDPIRGRFLAEDPMSPRLADPVTLHRYLYGRDNPINFSDPTGQDFTLIGQIWTNIVAKSVQFGAFVVRHRHTISAASNALSAINELKTIVAQQPKNLSVYEGAVVLWGGPVSNVLNLFSKYGLGSTNATGQGVAAALGLFSNAYQIAPAYYAPGLIFQLAGVEWGGGLLSGATNAVMTAVLSVFSLVSYDHIRTLPWNTANAGNYPNAEWKSWVVKMEATYLSTQVVGGFLAFTEFGDEFSQLATVAAFGVALSSTIELFIDTDTDWSNYQYRLNHRGQAPP